MGRRNDGEPSKGEARQKRRAFSRPALRECPGPTAPGAHRATDRFSWFGRCWRGHGIRSRRQAGTGPGAVSTPVERDPGDVPGRRMRPNRMDRGGPEGGRGAARWRQLPTMIDMEMPRGDVMSAVPGGVRAELRGRHKERLA